MYSLRFENNLHTIAGVRFASISKKTPLSKLSFAFVSLALPLLYRHLSVGNEGSEYDYWLLEANECSTVGGFPSNAILSGSVLNSRN